MAAHTRLFVPALQPFYTRVSEFSYPLIRVSAAGAVLVHGVGKLMTGAAPVAANLQHYQMPSPEALAYLIITMETVGAACIILGFLTRFFAVGLFIESLVIAFAVKLPNGFNANKDGYEMLLIWAVIFLAIALRGGGPYSIDRAIGREL